MGEQREIALLKHSLQVTKQALAESEALVLTLEEENQVLRARAAQAHEQLRAARSQPSWRLATRANAASGALKDSASGLVRLARQVKRRTLG